MADKPLVIPAMLSKFASLADKTLKFQVNTNELEPEIKARLFGYEQAFGYLFFSPTEMKEVEIPMDKPEFPNQKHPSEVLYGKMFKLFKTMQDRKLIKESAVFENWRRSEMQKLIEIYERKSIELMT